MGNVVVVASIFPKIILTNQVIVDVLKYCWHLSKSLLLSKDTTTILDIIILTFEIIYI
jgi:hypothetical protein